MEAIRGQSALWKKVHKMSLMLQSQNSIGLNSTSSQIKSSVPCMKAQQELVEFGIILSYMTNEVDTNNKGIAKFMLQHALHC